MDAARNITATLLCLVAAIWYLFTPQSLWGFLRFEAIVMLILITIGVTHGRSNLLVLWQAASQAVLDWFARRRKSM